MEHKRVTELKAIVESGEPGLVDGVSVGTGEAGSCLRVYELLNAKNRRQWETEPIEKVIARSAFVEFGMEMQKMGLDITKLGGERE